MKNKHVDIVLRSLIILWLIVAIALALAFIFPAEAAKIQLQSAPSYEGKQGLYLPNADTQRKVIARMKSGDVPKHKALSMQRLKVMCRKLGVAWPVYGCVASPSIEKLTKVSVFTWEGLSAHDRFYVLVHEYSHKLYGWKHR